MCTYISTPTPASRTDHSAAPAAARGCRGRARAAWIRLWPSPPARRACPGPAWRRGVLGPAVGGWRGGRATRLSVERGACIMSTLIFGMAGAGGRGGRPLAEYGGVGGGWWGRKGSAAAASSRRVGGDVLLLLALRDLASEREGPVCLPPPLLPLRRDSHLGLRNKEPRRGRGGAPIALCLCEGGFGGVGSHERGVFGCDRGGRGREGELVDESGLGLAPLRRLGRPCPMPDYSEDPRPAAKRLHGWRHGPCHASVRLLGCLVGGTGGSPNHPRSRLPNRIDSKAGSAGAGGG